MNDILHDFPNFFMNDVIVFLLWHLKEVIVNLIYPTILKITKPINSPPNKNSVSNQ